MTDTEIFPGSPASRPVCIAHWPELDCMPSPDLFALGLEIQATSGFCQQGRSWELIWRPVAAILVQLNSFYVLAGSFHLFCQLPLYILCLFFSQGFHLLLMNGKVFRCIRDCNAHLWLFLSTQRLNFFPPSEVSPGFCHGSGACVPASLAATVQACDQGSAMQMLLPQKHNQKLMIRGSKNCEDSILEKEGAGAAAGSLPNQLGHRGHSCLGGLLDYFSCLPRVSAKLSVHPCAA